MVCLAPIDESHLVEDVWYVLLRAGLLGIAELGSVFAGQQTLVSHQSHALIGHLVTFKVDLIIWTTCTQNMHIKKGQYFQKCYQTFVILLTQNHKIQISSKPVLYNNFFNTSKKHQTKANMLQKSCSLFCLKAFQL